MYENINEKVDVIAIFGKGFQDVKPFKLTWHGRQHIISEIGYKHKTREGNKVIHVFSCTDGHNFFELRFNAEDLKWILSRVWDGQTN